MKVGIIVIFDFFLIRVCRGFLDFLIFCFKGVVVDWRNLVLILLFVSIVLVIFIGEIFDLLFKVNDVNDVLGNFVFFFILNFIGVFFEIFREFVFDDVLDFLFLVC